jgi:hypothetical protein
VRSFAEREEVAKLIAAGLSDRQIERELGIPRTTVGGWRRGPAPAPRPTPACAICAAAPQLVPARSYANLLGAYLGGGHIVEMRRGVHRLTIYCSLGRKHERRIALAPWQQQIVDAHPDQLVRGLIDCDGSRHINRIKHPKRTYDYVRYEFTNRSQDIKRIFCEACDALGVQWRVMNRKSISVARRGSVARLDGFIGPKR